MKERKIDTGNIRNVYVFKEKLEETEVVIHKIFNNFKLK